MLQHMEKELNRWRKGMEVEISPCFLKLKFYKEKIMVCQFSPFSCVNHSFSDILNQILKAYFFSIFKKPFENEPIILLGEDVPVTEQMNTADKRKTADILESLETSKQTEVKAAATVSEAQLQNFDEERTKLYKQLDERVMIYTFFMLFLFPAPSGSQQIYQNISVKQIIR